MFKKIGEQSVITSNFSEIEKASHILLPGVGHFDYCMNQFNLSGLKGIIEEKVFNQNTPTLGICVGHQMLFKCSEEGIEDGLGWLEGRSVKIKKELLAKDYKIPNMGWCDMDLKNNATLLKGIEDPRFYMVHSYHVECDESLVSATTNYGYDFVSAVEKNNVFGTQFHPEKSHKFGMQLLKNFAKI